LVGTGSHAGLIDEPEVGLGNVPAQGNRLLGRQAALEELQSLLWQTRLLTLTGPGGSGKSRLAAALAAAVRADFVGGAWWADLCDTVDAELVAQTVATTVVPGGAVVDAEAAIARRLAGTSLLVLDNCEQLEPGAAKLVLDLMARVPSLRVIVTCAQPLGVTGEHVWRVPGLVVEGFSSIVGDQGSHDDGAIALFMERARAAAGSFQPGYAGTREAVAEICLWLDGMPLAIELVAARVASLSVGQIAERFKRDADLQRHNGASDRGRDGSLPRALEWSHQLLDSTEQLLFRRIAIFRGSFSAAAAEAVCADELVPETQVPELLRLLVERSLVALVDSPEGLRYRLHAAVREFAHAKLDQGDELSGVRKRHAEYFYRLGDQARTGLAGSEQVRWLAVLGLEIGNLRDTLRWLFGNAPVEAAQLTSALWPFAFQYGYYGEARAWFDRALTLESQLPPAVVIDLLLGAGEVSFLQCDYPAAIARVQQALTLVGVDGDRYAAASALQRLGSINREQARYEESRQFHERSSAIYQGLGDRLGVAASHNYMSFVGWLSGDYALAQSAGSRALEEFQHAGSQDGVAVALVNMGAGSMYAGDLEIAEQRLEKALEISRRLAFPEGVAWSMHGLAVLARRQHRPSRDQRLMLRDVLLVHQQLGDRWRTASALEEIAGAILVTENPTLAVNLLGCAQALRDRIGAPISAAEAPDRDAAITRLKQRLEARVFEAAWSQGRALDLAGAIDMAVAAIERLDAGTQGSSDLVGPAPILTPRELSVLRLLQQGQTNREIGASLYISPSTAGVHVANIARKLGVKHRVDVAARAQTLGLLSS
jgi:predicted ATPase/DNA-binding CsgD family transcriptional regulator